MKPKTEHNTGGLQSVFTVIVPDYPRLMKISDSKREAYYYFNGTTIKSNKSLLPNKFLRKPVKDKRALNTQDLIDPYYLYYKHPVTNNLCVPETDQEVLDAYKMGVKIRLGQYDSVKEQITPVVANPDEVGKPNYIHIRGQDLYSGNLNEFHRANMMNYIKDYFRPFVEKALIHWNITKISFEHYPLRLQTILFDNIQNEYSNSKEFPGQRWDLSNRLFPYVKAFPDLLTEMGIIEDDDRLRISKSEEVFIPLEESNLDNRQIIFKLFPDTREVVQNFKKYINYEKENKLKKKTVPRVKEKKKSKSFNANPVNKVPIVFNNPNPIN